MCEQLRCDFFPEVQLVIENIEKRIKTSLSKHCLVNAALASELYVRRRMDEVSHFYPNLIKNIGGNCSICDQKLVIMKERGWENDYNGSFCSFGICRKCEIYNEYKLTQYICHNCIENICNCKNKYNNKS